MRIKYYISRNMFFFFLIQIRKDMADSGRPRQAKFGKLGSVLLSLAQYFLKYQAEPK